MLLRGAGGLRALSCGCQPGIARVLGRADAGPLQPRRQQPRRAVTTAVLEQPGAATQRPTSYLTQFAVYKSRGAMCAKLISPVWKLTSSGDHYVSSEGKLLLEFAEAAPGSGSAPGQRRYNWDMKQAVALSALELGDIISVPPEEQVKLVHDASKFGSGKLSGMKNLSVQSKDGGRTWYFNLSSRDAAAGGQPVQHSTSLSRGEMAMFRRVCEFLLPHLQGWDAAVDAPLRYTSDGSSGGSSGGGY